MRTTKRSKHNAQLVEADKSYPLDEAVAILKKTYATKFDGSVDIQLKLSASANVSDQVVRGTTALPNGTGKPVRVIVLTKDEAGKAAKAAGADVVGDDDLIEKIMKGWLDFDVVVASPSMMKDIAKLGRVLGPRGLMPSPKAGTVTDKLADAVKEIKKGRIEYKMDKQSNLHSSIGRLSFEETALVENGKVLLDSVMQARPKSIKGYFIQSAHLSSTMGPGVKLDLSALIRDAANHE